MAVMLHHDLKPSSQNTVIAVFSPATRWLFANTTHFSCNVTGTEPSVFAELKRRLNYYQKFSSSNPSEGTDHSQVSLMGKPASYKLDQNL